MNSDNEFPKLKMEKAILVPEGIHAVSVFKIQNSEGVRFTFKLQNPVNDKLYVNGFCKLSKDEDSHPCLKDNSRLYRWLGALCQLEFEEGRDIDLNQMRNDLIHKKCFVKVKHRTSEGCAFAEVVKVFAVNDPRMQKQEANNG